MSLDEARHALPRVASVIERAMQLHALLRTEVDALAASGVRVTERNLTSEDELAGKPELSKRLDMARALYATMLSEVEAAEQLGAEVKSLEHGLADFWSFLDGETEVLLCWKVGERSIEHYHHPEAGFSGRKPIEGHRFLPSPAAGARQLQPLTEAQEAPEVETPEVREESPRDEA